MLDPQLKTYLDSLKKLPELPPDAALRKAFIDAGWTAPEIDEAFRYLKPAPPVPTPAPIRPAGSVSQPPLTNPRPFTSSIADIRPGAPVSQPEPLQTKPRVAWPEVSPQAAAAVPSQSSSQSPLSSPISTPQPMSAVQSGMVLQPKKKNYIPTLLGVLLLVAIAGGAAYAFFAKVGPFGKAPYDATNLITSYINSSLDLKSAHALIKFSAATKQKEVSVPYFEDVVPKAPGSSVSLTKELPSGALQSAFSVDGIVDMDMDISSSTSPVVGGRATIKGTFAGFSAEGIFEYVVKDKTTYLKLVSYPSAFDYNGTLGSIKGKWVRVSIDDAKELGSISPYATTPAEDFQSSVVQEKIRQNMRLAAALADKNGLFALQSEPVVDTVDGVSAYRYDLTLNRAAIEPFITEFFAQSSIEGLAAVSSEVKSALAEKEVSQFLDYITQVFSTSLWADSSGTFLRRLDGLKIAPGGDVSLKDVQVNLSLDSTISKQNESITVQVPTQDVISLEDAIIAVAGITKEEFQFQKDTESLASLRSALEYSFSASGRYPATLEELTKIYPIKVPKTITSYSSDGIHYRLQYFISLPKLGAATHSALDLYSKPRSLVYLSGTNTATESSSSLEALAAAKKDSDKDGLSDTLEEYLGTNKLLKDTDKDGISDFDDTDSIGYPSSGYPGSSF